MSVLRCCVLYNVVFRVCSGWVPCGFDEVWRPHPATGGKLGVADFLDLRAFRKKRTWEEDPPPEIKKRYYRRGLFTLAQKRKRRFAVLSSGRQPDNMERVETEGRTERKNSELLAVRHDRAAKQKGGRTVK